MYAKLPSRQRVNNRSILTQNTDQTKVTASKKEFKSRKILQHFVHLLELRLVLQGLITCR